MFFVNLLSRLAFFFVVLGLVGCGHLSRQSDSASWNRERATNRISGLEERVTFATNDLAGAPATLRAHRTFRFAFDRFDVSEADYPSIRFHADYLASNPNAHVRVEGHTDERGSREYNIGLGERRARAVVDILLSTGASADQISIVSYGKEKPEIGGHTEEAYQINRRAILVYEE